jgi:hypothetical protein
MTPRTTSRAAVAGFSAVAVALAACADPTQIVLQVSTDLACGDVGKVEVRVARSTTELDGAQAQVTEATSCSAGRIGSLVIVPSADDQAKVYVRATLFPKGTNDCTAAASGCIVTNAITTFEPKSSRDLPLVLAGVCKGKSCPSGQTCGVGAACVSAER